MIRTNVAEVLDALGDVDFPADKERLVTAAEDAGASGDVVAVLRAMPREEYGSRAEVARSVEVDPASDLDLSEAQRAEQARMGGRPGLSQHLRDVPKPPVQEELDRDREWWR
jgi:hypothetical protein